MTLDLMHAEVFQHLMSVVLVKNYNIWCSIRLNSEINAAPLFLDSTSKGFSADDIKKTGLYGYGYNFPVRWKL